jgi:ABC-type transport system involved in multi-copper enzyme maturation permease subunit
MLWHIIKKEFHQNIITSRFIIGTILCIIFMIAVKITLLDEQKMMIDAFNRKSTEKETDLKEFYVYSEITTEALKPPEPLAIFHEGVSKKLGGVITVRRQEVPFESSHYVLDNPLLAIFQSIDVVLIFKLVMSLLALLFAFDMFTGEKENGTLKLVLSTRLSRAQLFIGKYFGGLLSLTTALFLSFIIGLLILFFAPFIKLTFDMFTRILLIYFISIIFTASFFSIGALISSTTHRSVVSLAISLFIWVVLVIALPNLGDYVGSQLKKVEQSRIVEERIDAINQEFRQVLQDYREKNPRPEDWVISGSLNMNGGRYNLQIATANIMDYLDHFIPFCEKKMREFANRSYQKNISMIFYSRQRS